MPNNISSHTELTIRRPENIFVPGMYMTTPESHVERFAELTDSEVALAAYYQRELRKVLRGLFDVALCGLYVEEHQGYSVTSITLPFHVERLTRDFDLTVYQPHIEAYLASYDHEDDVELSRYDKVLRDHFRAVGVSSLTTSGLLVSTESTPTEERNTDVEEILDVDDESELPPAPPGKKYYICLGGSKNFQAFLCNNTMSKGEFLDEHADDVDEVLRPVFEDDKLTVRQDAKYAIPGFYIISPKQHYRSIDEMPQEYFEHCMLMAKRIKEHITALGIMQSHIYHDEKYRSPASAHFWVLPLPDKSDFNLTIYSTDIWTYLETFPRYRETGRQIREYNNHMRSVMRSD